MNLLIADDHALFKEALCYYLARERPDISVVQTDDLYEAELYLQDVSEKENLAVDLVLLDFFMPGMNGLEGIKKVKKIYPNIPVVLMSGVAVVEDVKEAMLLGCVGFFPKTLSCADLLKGMSIVLKGEKYIPVDLDSGKILDAFKEDSYPEVSMNSVEGDIHSRWMRFRESSMQERQNTIKEASKSQVVHITKREGDVLQHLVLGRKNKDIADALGVKTVTVKLHVRSICKKLKVENRTQAALKANELNLLNRR